MSENSYLFFVTFLTSTYILEYIIWGLTRRACRIEGRKKSFCSEELFNSFAVIENYSSKSAPREPNSQKGPPPLMTTDAFGQFFPPKFYRLLKTSVLAMGIDTLMMIIGAY